MSRGVNKVILIGNLGKDPEYAVLPANQRPVCSFTVATSEAWKDRTTGQQQERTEWHNCTAYDRLAEVCGEYLKKGSKVYIEGQIRTEKFPDKHSGQDRYFTKIVVREMQMLDSVSQSGAGYQKPAAAAPAATPTAQPVSFGGDNFDDDIPF